MSTKKITLRSNDDQLFEVEESEVLICETIKGMIEDDCASDQIPLPNVTGAVLSKVVEFSKRHAAASTGDEEKHEEELKKWNTEFVNVGQDLLFDLILAANYLNNKKLLDLTCQTVANQIKNYSVEEIRTLFNITNDFTPEEEENLRNENAWAFE